MSEIRCLRVIYRSSVAISADSIERGTRTGQVFVARKVTRAEAVLAFICGD